MTSAGNAKRDFREEARALVAQMTIGEKISQMRYQAPAIERLGIPAYNWWNEALHGVARCGTATVFPQAIAMAASFNPDLLHEVADAISTEARAKYNGHRTFGHTEIYQGLTCWSPNINIFRDPRWGRGQETYGEDPFLTGIMGTAFVKGLQGNDPVYRKADATLKHFAVHSGPESTRHTADLHVSRKDLWETYLAAFERCIRDADPSAVMGAYNRVYGMPACGSEFLLQECLRRKMGFRGYVVSDCGAIADFHEHHHVTANAEESAVMAVKAGCQLNCGQAYAALVAAYTDGMIDDAAITEAVEMLFETRLRLGLLAKDCPYDRIGPEVVECAAHRALNRRMAQETLVLLKNDGILPLAPGKTIAVRGPNADDVSVLLGNYNGTPSRYWTLLRGIQEAADGDVIYALGCDTTAPEPPADDSWRGGHWQEAILAARRADVVVLAMGLNPSLEGEENGTGEDDRRSLELPAPQLAFFREIMKEGRPTVFVNVSGCCVNLTEMDAACNAVVQCFYPGAEGGRALADILFGKCSPSGRLPLTFYHSVDELPPFEDYAMEGRTYRYFRGTPLYPFGHGLSYTAFEYTGLRLASDGKGGCRADFMLANTGCMDGAEAVQVYMAPAAPQPGDPIRKLVAARKLFMQKGTRQSVSIEIPADAFDFFSQDGERIRRTDPMTISVGPLSDAFACGVR